ncbi:MAG: hypothetical protein ACXWZP_02810 [Gaiellaceae bacterium]
MPSPAVRRTGALAALAAGACLAVGSAAGTAAAATSCAKVRAEARTGSAEEVAFLFITSGVLRQNPGCAYDLVTPALRKNRSRTAFTTGKGGLATYVTRKPNAVTADLTPRVRLSTEVGSWITLDAPDRKPRTFEIVLRKRDGRWLVDYWARAVGFG